MSTLSRVFEKKCQITTHNKDLNVEEKNIFQLNNRRVVTSAVSTFVTSNKLIPDAAIKNKRVPNICSFCIENIQSQIKHPLKRQRSHEEGSLNSTPSTEAQELRDALEKVNAAIAKNTIPQDQLNSLAGAIGRKIKTDLAAGSHSQASSRLDDIFADSYDVMYKNQPDGALKHLLEEIAGPTQMSSATCRKVVKCTEILQSIVEPRFISNVSLGEALLLMQISKSRNALDFLNKIAPTGSYATIKRTIAAIGAEKKSLPGNDVIIAFDNSQVIGRSWAIKYLGKQPISTVTSMIYCDIGESSKHQFQKEIPTALFPNDKNYEELLARYTSFTKNSLQIHRNYRKQHIETCLQILVNDCKFVNGQVEDSISQFSVELQYREIYQYSRVPEITRITPVVDLDPVQVNPNSYAAVSTVLDTILEYMEGTGRKYVQCVMDGAPYGICKKLLTETYKCSICDEVVPVALQPDHGSKHGNAVCSWKRKYKPILIRIGNGHVELNAVRAILSFFWEPFVKPIAKIMGFSSEGGLDFMKKNLDHHKGYNTLMIIYSAYSMELIYPYVREQLLRNMKPTYEGFCAWETNVSSKNATFRMAMDFCFTTLHSLHLFRSAIRNCNDHVAFHARHQLASLFYATTNIRYQEYMTHDTLYMLSLPKDIQMQIQMESSKRKIDGAAESFDFLLENRNKLYKSFLPADTTPTFENWVLVARTASHLERLREKAAERLELTFKPSSENQNRKSKLEIYQVRKRIRSFNLFVNESMPFMCVDQSKAVIDDTWVDYVKLSSQNQNTYTNAYARNAKVYLPSFVLGERDIDLDTAKVDDIKVAIAKKIQGLKEPFHTFFKKAFKQKSTIDEYKEFYSAVKTQILNQTQIEVNMEPLHYRDDFDDFYDDNEIDYDFDF